MKTSFGSQETRFFAYTQMRNKRTVSTGELCQPLGLSPDQERELFRRLTRRKMIARVRRGLYLVPERLPMGGAWSPDEILALNTLMADRGGRYQICGPNAFNRYGFDEQIPTRVYAYNNRISGERTIGTMILKLIKVANERLGGTEEVKTRSGEVAVYGSRARTLVDAVYDWSRFNTLPRAYDWIKQELQEKRIKPEQLVELCLAYGDIGTCRRLGVLLELLGVSELPLSKLVATLPVTTGSIPWIPGQAKRGSLNRRWAVVMNGDI